MEDKDELPWITLVEEVDEEYSPITKEFVINEFLTLKLEKDKTNIYIKGDLFYQCKHLLMSIPIKETERFDEIESIDEVADVLSWENEGQDAVENKIDSEDEFWGHCSNLQAWYEHDYDTRLLHSNLSFPLLKELANVGDPFAKIRFKEEIANRFENGYPTVVAYLFKNKLLNYLSEEERKDLIKENFRTVLNALETLTGETQLEVFKNLISTSKDTGLLGNNFTVLLKSIDLIKEYRNFHAFFNLVDYLRGTELLSEYKNQIETQLVAFIDRIKKIPKKNDDDKRRYHASFNLLNVMKIIGLKKEHVAALLNSLPDFNIEAYDLYDNLISTIMDEEQRFEWIKHILESSTKYFFNSYVFDNILSKIEDIEIFKENFDEIMLLFKKVLEGNIRKGNYEFYMVYKFIARFVEKLVQVGYLNITLSITPYCYHPDFYERRDHSIKGVYTLIEEIKGTEILGNLIPSLLLTFWRYSDKELSSDNYTLFSLLFEIALNKGNIEDNFIYFVVYYNWKDAGIQNLLEVFLRFLNKKKIVSLLSSVLHNPELILVDKNYERFLSFLEKLSEGRDNHLKKPIIEIKSKLLKIIKKETSLPL